MRLIIAAWAIAFGYVLIYYALSAFKVFPGHVANNKAAADPTTDNAHINAFGFATLLGLKPDDGSQGVNYARLPFAFVTTASSPSTSNTSNPTTQTGGVQTV